MKITYLLPLLALLLGTTTQAYAQTHYAGGDISLMPEYIQAGSKYLDYDGKAINGTVLDFFKAQGMNIMRVRLFVDPSAYNGPDKDSNACQSLDYIIPICKDIVDAGLPLMLDFHYSDTWADPSKQWTPAAWTNLSDDELYQKIYDYTAEVLQRLKDEGISPSHIATGNEISFGMLWGSWDTAESQLKKCFINSNNNWPRFIKLLNQAGKACREVCPEAKIVLHTERVGHNDVLKDFYTRMDAVDYDIIGLSYYPYFHGPLSNLESALNLLEIQCPDKRIMIVEAGYPYKWAVPGTTYDYSSTYPYSNAGQASFTHALVEKLNSHSKVNGLIWWWPEYNAYRTSLSGWYNAALFDSETGRALDAIKETASYAATLTGIENVSAEDNAPGIWYNLQGTPLYHRPSNPGIYIWNGHKIKI